MIKIPSRGLTTLEVVVVVTIIGVLIAVALPAFSKLRETQVLTAAANDTLASIGKARSNTLSSLNSSEYGVHFQSDSVIIFKGTAYSSGTSTNEIISISSPASITDVTLGGVSSSSGNIYFNRIYGVPSTTGTITLSTPTYTKVITISATGVASVN